MTDYCESCGQPLPAAVHNPWVDGPSNIQEAYGMTYHHLIEYCKRGLSHADIEWAKQQPYGTYCDIMRLAGRRPE